MKTLCILGCALLVLFAIVQYNDPDALLWSLIYLVPAAWAALAAFRPHTLRANLPFTLLGLCVILELIAVVYYWPTTSEFWRKDVWWETESAREGMGVMVAAAVMVIAFLRVLSLRLGKFSQA